VAPHILYLFGLYTAGPARRQSHPVSSVARAVSGFPERLRELNHANASFREDNGMNSVGHEVLYTLRPGRALLSSRQNPLAGSSSDDAGPNSSSPESQLCWVNSGERPGDLTPETSSWHGVLVSAMATHGRASAYDISCYRNSCLYYLRTYCVNGKLYSRSESGLACKGGIELCDSSWAIACP